jgi:hypothetical protein
MTRRSTKTPTKSARLREGLARGESLRTAAKAAGVPVSTASRWQSKPGAKAGAKAKASPPSVDVATVAEVAAVLDAPKPIGLPAIIARAEVVRALLARVEGPVERDEFPATSFIAIARYLDELDRLIVELTPPAPRNPEDDPSVLEATRILVARFESMVADAERAIGT